MDNLTHSLFAVTLGRTPLGRAGRGATATLLIASNAPDLDIVATAGGAIKYMEWHRGMTHGPIGVFGLAFLTALLVQAARRLNPRWRHDGEDAPFTMLVALALVGTVCHVLMDLPTSYGTRFLSPFSWRWYAVDWMPIVDVYLLIVLGAGLLFPWLTRQPPSAGRRNAMIVLTLMAANYGLRAYTHHAAMELAPRLFGPTLPAMCDAPPASSGLLESWPKPEASPPRGGARCLVDLAAMPSPMSPFDWRIIARMSNAYESHDVNVLDWRLRGATDGSAAFWRRVVRYPNIWTPAVRQAAVTRAGTAFLGFSRLPAARTVVDADGTTIVRFIDIRFASRAFAVEEPVRRVQPFTATIRIDRDGRVLSHTLGR